MSILDLFCSVDAFWQQFEPLWEREQLASGRRQRKRATRLSPSEIMTILILFQQSGYRTFKGFYTQYVQTQLPAEFPGLVSYTRFVALMPRVPLPLALYLHTQLGACTGIRFRRRCRSATTPALPSIASVAPMRGATRPRSAGSMASNCIWSSTSGVNCSPSV